MRALAKGTARRYPANLAASSRRFRGSSRVGRAASCSLRVGRILGLIGTCAFLCTRTSVTAASTRPGSLANSRGTGCAHGNLSRDRRATPSRRGVVGASAVQTRPGADPVVLGDGPGPPGKDRRFAAGPGRPGCRHSRWGHVKPRPDHDTFDLGGRHRVHRPIVERRRLRRRVRAICCACASVPPFDRYAVIPVARNVWQHVEGGSPASEARRLIIASTTRLSSARTRQAPPGRVHALRRAPPSAPRARPPRK